MRMQNIKMNYTYVFQENLMFSYINLMQKEEKTDLAIVYSATKLSVESFLSDSLVSFCSSTPLGTQGGFFTFSTSLSQGGPKKEIKLGDPPLLIPQETSFEVLKSLDPLDYSPD